MQQPSTPVVVTVDPNAVPSPAAILRGMQARREALGEQLDNVEDRRSETVERLTESRSQGLDVSGLEARLKSLDQQIASIEATIQLADADVARASAVPNAIQPTPPPVRRGPPEEVFVLGGMFMVFVLFPIAIAFARRLWKRPVATAAALPSEVTDRLRAIEQSVESVAVEVERIGEGQRFMSRVFTERAEVMQKALGEGAAQPIEVGSRERVGERR